MIFLYILFRIFMWSTTPECWMLALVLFMEQCFGVRWLSYTGKSIESINSFTNAKLRNFPPLWKKTFELYKESPLQNRTFSSIMAELRNLANLCKTSIGIKYTVRWYSGCVFSLDKKIWIAKLVAFWFAMRELSVQS